MPLTLSQRAERIVQAEIRAMSLECEKVGGINLAQGVCDLEVPLPVRRAAQQAIEQGRNSYTRCDGIPELRHGIARKLREFNRIEVDPETQITVTVGSTGAFYCACLALLNPADEVILFEPYYGYHLNTLLAVEAVPVYVATRPPDWSFRAEELEAAVTPRTRAIVVNTPANPSGKVFTLAELEQIAELARRHDLFILTDEIYEYFVYDGQRHISPASLTGLADRTITVSGYSKAFSITGWRIGYSVAEPRWATMISYISDLIYVCAPSPLQAGVAAGIQELSSDYYGQLASEYRKKRDLLCEVLEEIGLRPHIPAGAYYVLADASRLPGRASKEKAMYLMHQTGVATVPGDSFFNGTGGANLLRFCFAKQDSDLEEACRRLRKLAVAPAVLRR